MKVAVVATMRNEAHTIGDLLEAIAAQSRVPDEVILVDGGSTDGTVAVARAWADRPRVLSHLYLYVKGVNGADRTEASRSARPPALRLLKAPGSNIAQGRNHGIAAARSPIIAITDAGCAPAPDWLARMSGPLERDPGLGLVQGVVLPQPANHLEACIARCSLAFRVNIGEGAFYPTARTLAFRHDVWAQVGGFPEHLDFGEDAAFIVAVASTGTQVHVEPQAVVHWRPRGSYWEVVQQFYHYAHGLAQAGLSRTFHLRTIAQSVGGVLCISLGILLRHWLPWMLLLLLADFYLWRKARQGCFDIPSWRTYYRVPLVLLAIHLGTMAGIIHGNSLRLRTRFNHARTTQAKQR
jgi:glycosyltransferase involved in cell wall biosynthesis